MKIYIDKILWNIYLFIIFLIGYYFLEWKRNHVISFFFFYILEVM